MAQGLEQGYRDRAQVAVAAIQPKHGEAPLVAVVRDPGGELGLADAALAGDGGDHGRARSLQPRLQAGPLLLARCEVGARRLGREAQAEPRRRGGFGDRRGGDEAARGGRDIRAAREEERQGPLGLVVGLARADGGEGFLDRCTLADVLEKVLGEAQCPADLDGTPVAHGDRHMAAPEEPLRHAGGAAEGAGRGRGARAEEGCLEGLGAVGDPGGEVVAPHAASAQGEAAAVIGVLSAVAGDVQGVDAVVVAVGVERGAEGAGGGVLHPRDVEAGALGDLAERLGVGAEVVARGGEIVLVRGGDEEPILGG